MRRFRLGLAPLALAATLACQNPDDLLLEPPDPLLDSHCRVDCGDGGDGIPRPPISREDVARIAITGTTSATERNIKLNGSTYPFIIPAYSWENKVRANVRARGALIDTIDRTHEGGSGWRHTSNFATGLDCAENSFKGSVSAVGWHTAQFEYSVGPIPGRHQMTYGSSDDFTCNTMVKQRTEPADAVCGGPPIDMGEDFCPGQGNPSGGGGGGSQWDPWTYCVIEVTYYRDSGLLISSRLLYCY